MKVKEAHMQAFPFIEPYEDDNVKAYHSGLDLRDYFAAMAMRSQPWQDQNDSYANHADRCYVMADAMLKARK